MFKRMIQPGKSSFLLTASLICLGLVVAHGVTSSILLAHTNCSPYSRIADLLFGVLLIAIACIISLRNSGSQIFHQLRRNRPLSLLLVLLLALTALILFLASANRVGAIETFSAVAVDTALFWAVLVLYTANKAPTERLVHFIALVIGFMGLALVFLYIIGVQQQLDASLGYGHCGELSQLWVGRTGGILRSRGLSRNPNELGALLVLPLVIVLSIISRQRKRSLTLWVSFLGILGLLVLTFSRSAWTGAIIAIVVWILIDSSPRKFIGRHKTPILIVTLFAMLVASFSLVRSSTYKQLILHESNSGSSTSQHFEKKKAGVQYILDHPLGTGPGSAGVVGATLDQGPYIETESSYLNIAAQYGVVGLLMFLSLLALIIRLLFASEQPYARPLCAGFIGLAFIGFLIPVWANLTVSLFAGVLLGFALVDKKALKA